MDITPQQLAEQLKHDASLQLVDVRESAEISEGRIPGAEHIPLGELSARSGELDQSRPVVVVCRSGRRSAVGADHLAATGFTAYTMTGGMLDWAAGGLPVA
ncbi:rhodanese-related sulfurtransferase [Cryobacterium psychrophilum]|nr:rhodanese-like domain-containing protein [Cryobacterium psychrophilum]TDW30039.1 rhodanese-related sulfurtransferase [Cryobacterium psychrophilum]